MAVAALSESVQVNAESPIIDVKQNASTLSIQSDLIDLIPKGRDFTQVVNSAPGTQQEGQGGGIMIDGASGSENRFIVDGMDTTALQTGVSNKEVLTDFLAEVQVEVVRLQRRVRAATEGGVISAITRSGNNRFLGDRLLRAERLVQGRAGGLAAAEPHQSERCRVRSRRATDQYGRAGAVARRPDQAESAVVLRRLPAADLGMNARTVTFTQNGQTRSRQESDARSQPELERDRAGDERLALPRQRHQRDGARQRLAARQGPAARACRTRRSSRIHCAATRSTTFTASRTGSSTPKT